MPCLHRRDLKIGRRNPGEFVTAILRFGSRLDQVEPASLSGTLTQ